MAARSTRQKIKDRCGRLIDEQEQFRTHLYEMHTMSAGRISALEDAIPGLLSMSELIIDTCTLLRNEL